LESAVILLFPRATPAPEVVQPPSGGYSYSVDWWSLGVSAYEMLRGHRPFSLEKNMSSNSLFTLLTHTRPSASVNWDTHTCDMLKMVGPDVSALRNTLTIIPSLVIV